MASSRHRRALGLDAGCAEMDLHNNLGVEVTQLRAHNG